MSARQNHQLNENALNCLKSDCKKLTAEQKHTLMMAFIDALVCCCDKMDLNTKEALFAVCFARELILELKKLDDYSGPLDKSDKTDRDFKFVLEAMIVIQKPELIRDLITATQQQGSTLVSDEHGVLLNAVINTLHVMKLAHPEFEDMRRSIHVSNFHRDEMLARRSFMKKVLAAGGAVAGFAGPDRFLKKHDSDTPATAFFKTLTTFTGFMGGVYMGSAIEKIAEIICMYDQKVQKAKVHQLVQESFGQLQQVYNMIDPSAIPRNLGR